MAFKEDIKRRLKEQDSALLSSYLRTYRLNTKTETQKRLNYHIEKCRKFLATNHEKVTRKRREYTKKLEYFMQIKKILRRLK